MPQPGIGVAGGKDETDLVGAHRFFPGEGAGEFG
jgi:hypothetical protein